MESDQKWQPPDPLATFSFSRSLGGLGSLPTSAAPTDKVLDENGEYIGTTCDGVSFPKAELEQPTDCNPTPPSCTGCDTSYTPSTGRQNEVNLKMSRLHTDPTYPEHMKTTARLLNSQGVWKFPVQLCVIYDVWDNGVPRAEGDMTVTRVEIASLDVLESTIDELAVIWHENAEQAS